jgi:glycosyltransferase involved in cell wall biosynthesis
MASSESEQVDRRQPHTASICFVTEEFTPTVSGLAVSSQRIVGFLRDAGFEVHVVVPDTLPDNEALCSSVENGYAVHRVDRGRHELETRMALHRAVKRLDREISFDLFHGFFLPAALPCLAPARTQKLGRRRSVIASIRGTDASTLVLHPLMRPPLLQALREADWITSVNQMYLDQMDKEVNLAARSSVIRNSLPGLPRTWELTRENAGVVGTSGKFRQVKDIPLLVRAFQHAQPAAERLLLIGAFYEAAEESWTRTLVEEFGLQQQFELTGPLPHQDAVLQLNRLRLYVQSSAMEGMPNALLEAAAVGVPIVATAVGGIPEVFTHGKDALLVPHGDPLALGRAIRSVLENDELAKALATQASSLGGRYSSAQERQQWVDLHESLALRASEETTQ